MRSNTKFSVLIVVAAISVLAGATFAKAAAPSISVTLPDPSNIVRVSVYNSDSNSAVTLVQNQNTAVNSINLGQTDNQGNLSQVIKLNVDGSNSPVNINVVVNGISSAIVAVYPFGVSAPTKGSVLGSSTYNNGTLVLENGTISLVYKNTKAGFTNYKAFTGLGYKVSNVVPADINGMGVAGYLIKTASAAHPAGSWVSSKGTVYFVDPSGLIPISDMDTFTNNGGNVPNIVPANSYDLKKVKLSIMVMDDARLK
ncbi:MAG: hypothetical protein JWO40_264 [Candidatus Doudnabacteria bacterium]|nr:hypothetical protein [Candidatus Doudnabacteria bacterium]